MRTARQVERAMETDEKHEELKEKRLLRHPSKPCVLNPKFFQVRG